MVTNHLHPRKRDRRDHQGLKSHRLQDKNCKSPEEKEPQEEIEAASEEEVIEEETEVEMTNTLQELTKRELHLNKGMNITEKIDNQKDQTEEEVSEEKVEVSEEKEEVSEEKEEVAEEATTETRNLNLLKAVELHLKTPEEEEGSAVETEETTEAKIDSNHTEEAEVAVVEDLTSMMVPAKEETMMNSLPEAEEEASAVLEEVHSEVEEASQEENHPLILKR